MHQVYNCISIHYIITMPPTKNKPDIKCKHHKPKENSQTCTLLKKNIIYKKTSTVSHTYVTPTSFHRWPTSEKKKSWKEMLRFWCYLSMFHCLKQHESDWPHALLVTTFDCHIVFVHLSVVFKAPERWNFARITFQACSNMKWPKKRCWNGNT